MAQFSASTSRPLPKRASRRKKIHFFFRPRWGIVANVFAGAAKLALVMMLMGSIGLHWALLQTVAWAGMIVTYTQESSSLTTALERTFDGKHPCKICVVVAQGKKAEKHSDQLPVIQKLELFSESTPAFVPALRLESDLHPIPSLSAPDRSSPPPFLPPRTA